MKNSKNIVIFQVLVSEIKGVKLPNVLNTFRVQVWFQNGFEIGLGTSRFCAISYEISQINFRKFEKVLKKHTKFEQHFFKLMKETLPRIRKSAKDQVKASEMSLQMEVNGVL